MKKSWGGPGAQGRGSLHPYYHQARHYTGTGDSSSGNVARIATVLLPQGWTSPLPAVCADEQLPGRDDPLPRPPSRELASLSVFKKN